MTILKYIQYWDIKSVIYVKVQFREDKSAIWDGQKYNLG